MVLLYAIMTCYGGGFSSVPAYIGDIFGTKQLGAIHGYILTAWAMAGIVGPYLISFIYDRTNSYNLTMLIFGVFFIVAFAISLWIRMDMKRLRDELESKDTIQSVPRNLVTEAK